MLEPRGSDPYRSAFTDSPSSEDLRVAESIGKQLLDAPRTPLVWTGDGVRADRRGPVQSVRHAMARDFRPTRPAEATVAAIAKVLVIQALRRQSPADVRGWLLGAWGPDAQRAMVARVLAAVHREWLPGESVTVGYEPRCQRTRIAWPWGGVSDVHDDFLVSGIWRSYFGARDQPELGAHLLRFVHGSAR